VTIFFPNMSRHHRGKLQEIVKLQLHREDAQRRRRRRRRRFVGRFSHRPASEHRELRHGRRATALQQHGASLN